MTDRAHTDGWRWVIYRQVADWLADPSDSREARLKALIVQYRLEHQRVRRDGDEPEWAMDYR